MNYGQQRALAPTVKLACAVIGKHEANVDAVWRYNHAAGTSAFLH